MSATTAAIIGGTGLYSLEGVEQLDEIELDTPFGTPSSKIVRGRLGKVELLFLARHGEGHTLLPTEINSHANIWALKKLGAEWCVSVSAVGSLVESHAPGHAVIPDQIIDRTRNREDTFFGRGLCAHIAFADPFCPVLSELLGDCAEEAARDRHGRVHRGGTYLCMEGPAFSTRSESHLYRSWGASIIGMTALPEAKLAREAEMAYATLALVTDYDCWRAPDEDVDVPDILATMAKNVVYAKAVLKALVPKLADHHPSPLASRALEQAIITKPELIPDDTKEDLEPLIGRYL